MEFSRLQSDGTTTGTAFHGKETEERQISGESLFWTPPTAAGIVVTERTALQHTPLLAAHNVIATDVSILPLDVMQRIPDPANKQKTVARHAKEHPLERIFKRSPNGETTPARYTAAMMGHALTHGNGYSEITRKGNGRPYALDLLDPDTTAVRRLSNGKLGYQTAGGWIPARDVVHVAGLGYDGLTGWNFIKFVRQAIGVGIAAESYGADYFANGSEPGGYIEHPGKLNNKEAIERLRSGVENRHQGPGKRHRIGVLEEGAKFHTSTSDPEKSQLVEARKFQAIDVIRPWRVPPHKVGAMDNAHLANIEASNLDYLMTTLIGWLTAIEQEYNLKLLTDAEWQAGYYLIHDCSALLRADTKTRYAVHEIAVRNGIASRNEVRRKENEPPIPAEEGGDLYTIQAQVVPLHMAGAAFTTPGTAPGQAPPPGEPTAPDNGAPSGGDTAAPTDLGDQP